MNERVVGGFAAVGRINLASQVYDALLERIVHGYLEPGARLNIDQLARDLGVSVTPVRDALVRLCSQQLVQLESYKGYRVLPALDEDQVNHLFDARMLIEVGAVRAGIARLGPHELRPLFDHLARLRGLTRAAPPEEFHAVIAGDQEFHRTLVAAAGNAFILDMYELLIPLIHINRLKNARSSFFTQQQRIADEHAAILAAYERRDVAAAEESVRQHVLEAQARVDHLLQVSSKADVTA